MSTSGERSIEIAAGLLRRAATEAVTRQRRIRACTITALAAVALATAVGSGLISGSTGLRAALGGLAILVAVLQIGAVVWNLRPGPHTLRLRRALVPALVPALEVSAVQRIARFGGAAASPWLIRATTEGTRTTVTAAHALEIPGYEPPTEFYGGGGP